jgi:hypothetical protein
VWWKCQGVKNISLLLPIRTLPWIMASYRTILSVRAYNVGRINFRKQLRERAIISNLIIWIDLGRTSKSRKCCQNLFSPVHLFTDPKSQIFWDQTITKIWLGYLRCCPPLACTPWQLRHLPPNVVICITWAIPVYWGRFLRIQVLRHDCLIFRWKILSFCHFGGRDHA